MLIWSPWGQIWAGSARSNRGQILYLAESGHVIYQIERIEAAIDLVPILLKLGHYVMRDGRQIVKSSYSCQYVIRVIPSLDF